MIICIYVYVWEKYEHVLLLECSKTQGAERPLNQDAHNNDPWGPLGDRIIKDLSEGLGGSAPRVALS